MNRMNSYESLIFTIIKENQNRPYVVIDLRFYKVKKRFLKMCGFVENNTLVGSRLMQESALALLENDFLDTNLINFLEGLNYSLKQGNKYLLAVKQNSLDLYGEE